MFKSTAYQKNLHNWSTTTTPPPKNPASGTRSTRARGTLTRSSNLSNSNASKPAHNNTPPMYQSVNVPAPPSAQSSGPIPTTPQALQSTYSSRLRTGATLLMQPILANSTAAASRTATRRGGVVNYADPGSGDDIPDAGALDSDDSDFVASGGTRTSIRQTKARMATGMSVFNYSTGVTTTPHAPPPPRPEKAELDQSYLGMIPPARFIKPRLVHPTVHDYPCVVISHFLGFRLTACIVLQMPWKNKRRKGRRLFRYASNSKRTRIESAIASSGIYRRDS